MVSLGEGEDDPSPGGYRCILVTLHAEWSANEGPMDLPIGSNAHLGGGLSSALLVISSADPSDVKDAMSWPNRARIVRSVSDNLMVEGVINGDSTTAMVFGVCGGPILE